MLLHRKRRERRKDSNTNRTIIYSLKELKMEKNRKKNEYDNSNNNNALFFCSEQKLLQIEQIQIIIEQKYVKIL